MATFLSINPDNPEERKLRQVVDVLAKGGLIIYPTDTVYGIGCDLTNQRAVQRLCQLKGIKPNKMNLSFICYDLSDISSYAKQLDNSVFKLMKKTLPGPYTYILESSNKVPKILNVKKKQVGIRVPDHNIPRLIVQMLGNPIISSSIKDDDNVIEYTTDPSLIYDNYHKLVDIVIDGGYGGNIPSTVVNCTNSAFEVVREGAGDIHQYI
ncbi:MAG: L-threonylcarbamoyladenylate synthase [Flammeovirgaceae bacterium]